MLHEGAKRNREERRGLGRAVGRWGEDEAMAGVKARRWWGDGMAAKGFCSPPAASLLLALLLLPRPLFACYLGGPGDAAGHGVELGHPDAAVVLRVPDPHCAVLPRRGELAGVGRVGCEPEDAVRVVPRRHRALV